MSQVEQTSRRLRHRTLARLKPAMNLTMAAFLMSLTITVVNAYYALKGSEIAVQPPRQAILYRDGEGTYSVLTIGLRSDLINLADGYGDVLTGARLTPDGGKTWFEYQGAIKTVFNAAAARAAASCELEARCVGLPGLLVVERSDELVALESGAAKSVNLSFPLVGWNCAGDASMCRRFSDFDRSVRLIQGKPLRLTLELAFQSDGSRKILCDTAAADAAYLSKIGWVSLACTEGRVSGGSVI